MQISALLRVLSCQLSGKIKPSQQPVAITLMTSRHQHGANMCSPPSPRTSPQTVGQSLRMQITQLGSLNQSVVRSSKILRNSLGSCQLVELLPCNNWSQGSNARIHPSPSPSQTSDLYLRPYRLRTHIAHVGSELPTRPLGPRLLRLPLGL